MAHLIDGYKKVEGRYPTFEGYLVTFNCKKCRYTWDIDEHDIEMSELDELSFIDDLIENSITHCPICGHEHIKRITPLSR
ncbi:MAG: hypothetical protein HZC28_05615 [Spirochaetes bacterium]|nr:hypothetical protein [Spirochaetota bacterium]